MVGTSSQSPVQPTYSSLCCQRSEMILTLGKGGIFQFLPEPAAQTTLRKGLWFMTTASALSLTRFRPCCGSPFLPQDFTSSLTATIHVPPLQPLPEQPFPQIQIDNLGYLHSPSCEPSLSPDCLPQSSWVCLEPTHTGP